MHEDETFCNYYFQGIRRQPVFTTEEEKQNNTIRTRAVTFEHAQFPMKDFDLGERITNMTTRKNTLIFGHEMYFWWLVTAWSGVPAMFINDDFLSVAQSDGGPNYGLLLWAGLISMFPFVVFQVIWWQD